jgi:hypothetical protein
MQDEKAQKNHYIPKQARSEPAELFYETYAKAKGYRTAGPQSPRMKKWHETSVYERAAWRLLLREMVTVAGKIPTTPPARDMVTMTISEDDAYVTSSIPQDQIKSPQAKKMLADMRQELERINKERKDAEKDAG